MPDGMAYESLLLPWSFSGFNNGVTALYPIRSIQLFGWDTVVERAMPRDPALETKALGGPSKPCFGLSGLPSSLEGRLLERASGRLQ